jgi:hypothetical protein
VANAKDGSLGIFNSLFANAKNFAEGDDEDKGTEGQEGFKKGDKLDERAWALDAALGNKEVTAAELKLTSVKVDAVDVKLGAGSVALSGAKIPDDPFFDKVSFIGACGDTCDEFAGWTSFPTK